MAFPRNSPVAGEYAPDDGAVEQANQQGAQDGSRTTLDHAKRQQIAEIAEDQAAGPHMDGLPAAEQPDGEPAQYHDARANRPEGSLAATHDKQPENGEWQAVGGQMGPSAVQERRQGDADEAGPAARDDAELVQLQPAAANPIQQFASPHHGEQAADDEQGAFGGGRHCGSISTAFHGRQQAQASNDDAPPWTSCVPAMR